jgi:lysozyme family protein
MKENWESSFARMIKSEGGYVNDSHDSGGETNLGVTKAAWASYMGRPIKDGEMKLLTVDQVKPFYKKLYWDKVKGDDLPSGIDYAVFDFAVNGGTGQSSKFIQRSVGAIADGAIGPATMALISKTDSTKLLETFTQEKRDFYNAIVKNKPTQIKFLKGWMNRTDEVHKIAKSMLK